MSGSDAEPRPGAPLDRPRWGWPLAALLALLGTVWVGYQGWRALETRTGRGAVDLRLRHAEVTDWLAGRPVYAENHDAMYPPASYALLALPFGGLGLRPARLLWLALELLLVVLVARALPGVAGVRDGPLRAVFLALPFGTYPVGASIGNGQLGLPVLAALLALLVRLGRGAGRPVGTGEAWLLAGLMVLALVKPTLAAPFFWLLLVRGGLAPAALCVALYALLTWLASLWQPDGPLELLRDWLHRGRIGAHWGATRGEGAIRTVEPGGLHLTHVNLHSLLAALGHTRHAALATASALGLLGLWLAVHRRAPLWPLVGVTALVARTMTYHAWYDDVVLLLPLVALWRLHRGLDPSRPGPARAAGPAFWANLALLLAPGTVYSLPRPLANAAVVLHTALLLATLVLLAAAARRPPRVDPAPAA